MGYEYPLSPPRPLLSCSSVRLTPSVLATEIYDIFKEDWFQFRSSVVSVCSRYPRDVRHDWTELFATLSPFPPLPSPPLSYAATDRKESEALAVRAVAADRAMVEAHAELARARERYAVGFPHPPPPPFPLLHSLR